MQLLESIETHGYFWQAENPDKRMTGVLRISEKGDSSLEMYGALDSHHHTPLQQLTGEKLHLLGVTAKSGPITLTDCIVVKQNQAVNVALLCKYSLRVGCVFWGAYFDAGEISFWNMTFSVEGLNEWFAFHHQPFSHDADPTSPMSVTYNQPEPTTFSISDDLNICFYMRAGTTSSLFEQSISTKMSICVESKRPLPFSEFMQVLQKVRNFICLTIDRTVSFTSVSGTRSEPNAPYTPHDTVAIYSQFDPYDRPREDISVGHALIAFSQISHRIQEFLSRWMERYDDYAPTFNLYFSVSENRYMHLEGRFLFLVQGIESLHRRSSSETQMSEKEFDNLLDSIVRITPDTRRRWVQEKLKYGNELSLRVRIRRMVSPFNDLFGTKAARRTFIHQVVNTRNYLTHYDECIKNQAVTDPEELLDLYSKLEGLVQLHLLRLLGIGTDDIIAIAMQYRPLRRKLGYV